jgi:hypothetical protein
MGNSAELAGYAVQQVFTGLYFGAGHMKTFYLTRFLSQARVYLDESRAQRVAHRLSRRHGGVFVARVVAAHSDQIVIEAQPSRDSPQQILRSNKEIRRR